MSLSQPLYPCKLFKSKALSSQTPLVAQWINPPANAEAMGSIPGLERCPGEGEIYPLQYSGLENFMDCIYTYRPGGCKESDTTGQLSQLII